MTTLLFPSLDDQIEMIGYNSFFDPEPGKPSVANVIGYSEVTDFYDYNEKTCGEAFLRTDTIFGIDSNWIPCFYVRNTGEYSCCSEEDEEIDELESNCNNLITFNSFDEAIQMIKRELVYIQSLLDNKGPDPYGYANNYNKTDYHTKKEKYRENVLCKVISLDTMLFEVPKVSYKDSILNIYGKIEILIVSK